MVGNMKNRDTGEEEKLWYASSLLCTYSVWHGLNM